jgi:hypothetical protein
MTVGLENGNILLAGICPADDAESLLRLILNDRRAIVDWRACDEAHTAVIQILLAAKPELLGPSANPFLHSRIAPLIGDRRSGAHSSD